MTFYLVLKNSKFKLHNKITVYRIDLHTKNVCVCVCVCVCGHESWDNFIHSFATHLNSISAITIMKWMASNLSSYSSYCLKIKPEYYSSAEVNFLQFTIKVY